jgi:two-component system cell cycle sensor histidine kinase/response regulator CckA
MPHRRIHPQIFCKNYHFFTCLTIPREARFDSVSPNDSSNTASRTVLVVDDEPDVLRLIQSILTEEGYEVIAAKSADSAIKAFERLGRPPDLLLTDVVMPGMSGPMLVDHLLQVEPHLKVLFMSAYDDRQVVQRYVVEKGFRLIAKPFTIKALRTVIEATLKESGAARGEPGH